MRHILVITTSFTNEMPGAESAGTFVADFTRTLSRRVRVTVVAPGTKNCMEYRQGYEVQRYRVPRQPLSLLKPARPADWPAILRTLRAGRIACDAVAMRKRIDHVLALWALPSGMWARNLQLRHAVPYSIWALGSDIWNMSHIIGVRQLLNKVLQDASHRFADGRRLCQDVSELCGKPSVFLPSCRELPVMQRENRVKTAGIRFAYLGRWHPNKGIDLWLNAIEKLDDGAWSRIDEIRIAGGGPLKALVEDAVTGLTARGRPVRCMGFLDPAAAAGLLAWADYLVIPSRIESIPVVFSDAMQAGCPVIVTPVGDMPELLEEYRAGIIARAVSDEALVTAMHKALDTPPLLFEDGLRRARDAFDIKTSVEVLLRTIKMTGPA